MTMRARSGSVERARRATSRAGTRAIARVLADEDRDLGVLEVAAGVAARAAEELAVDPELTRLFLGEGVGGVDRSERGAVARA